MTETTLQPTDVRLTFAPAVRTGTEVTAAVTPDVLDRPTPCDDMDGRTLAAHLVHVLDRVAALGRGEDPFTRARFDGHVSEVTVHTWDLAKALGVDPAWHDQPVGVALVGVDGFLPASGNRRCSTSLGAPSNGGLMR